MDKLVTMNAQSKIQVSSRFAKIMADRRATLAKKEDAEDRNSWLMEVPFKPMV